MKLKQEMLDRRWPEPESRHRDWDWVPAWADAGNVIRKRIERDRLARDVEAYLARGGVIKLIPPGRSWLIARQEVLPMKPINSKQQAPG